MATAKKATNGGAKAPAKKASAAKTAAKKSPAKLPAASKKASAPAAKAPAKKAPKAAPAAKKPAVATKKPAVAPKKAAVAKKTVPAPKKPASAPKKPAPAAKKAAVPAKKVAVPPKKAVVPAKKVAVPAKKVAVQAAKAPSKKAAAPVKKAPAKGKIGRLPLPPPPPPPLRGGALRQEPLTKEQMKGFRERLAVELEFIKGNLDALTRDALRQQSESAGDVGVHSTHMADHGTDNFDRDINLLLASGRQEAIYAIEDALRRMNAGSFGTCEVCGNPIGFDRLDAMPYAKMCIECKKDLEKGKGRPTFRPYSRETSLQASQDGADREPVEGGDNPGDAGGGAE